jgi:glyoxylase-like metal-dependent hydrolase (beta-lactamase superfamily II)
MRTFVTADDRFLLTDPMGALDRGGVSEQFLKAFGLEKFKEPDEVVELEDLATFEVAGMQITSIFAPGHTKGSVMFTIDNQQLISGDVLFAGSIGRTDLPTGSASQMRKTLRDRILTLPDSLNVLPGHGGQTTIGIERVRNPYLQDDFLDQNGR